MWAETAVAVGVGVGNWVAVGDGVFVGAGVAVGVEVGWRTAIADGEAALMAGAVGVGGCAASRQPVTPKARINKKRLSVKRIKSASMPLLLCRNGDVNITDRRRISRKHLTAAHRRHACQDIGIGFAAKGDGENLDTVRFGIGR